MSDTSDDERGVYEGPTDGSDPDDEVDSHPASSAASRAQDMISKRVTANTAAGYKAKLRTMGRWLNVNVPEQALVDGEGYPILPLDPLLTLTFFGSLVESRSTHHPVFGKPSKKLLDNGGHLSSGYVAGFKSALFWLHAEKKLEFPSSLDTDLNRFMKGYRKEVASLKEKGEMTVFEGKQALAFSGYKMLARQFLELLPEATSHGNRRTPVGSNMATTWAMGFFAWTFLIFQWNLITRFNLMF